LSPGWSNNIQPFWLVQHIFEAFIPSASGNQPMAVPAAFPAYKRQGGKYPTGNELQTKYDARAARCPFNFTIQV
jgi:hypothetical protein